MFSEIEREYKKGLQQKRFMTYYWPRAIIYSTILILVGLFVGINHWIIYSCVVVILLGLIATFLLHDLHRANKTIPAVRESKGFSAKFRAYIIADDKKRLDNLVKDLAKNRVYTKDDLNVMLEHYRSILPISTKPNFLEWFLTTIITLASVVLVTYNDESGSINMHQFELALVVAAFVATPLIIAKIVVVIIEKTRTRLDTNLIEDLAYIYVNFDEFQEKLNS